MKKDNKSLKKDIDYGSIFLLGLSVLAVFFLIWTFTGKWPWVGQPYNSYMLQARSWLEGRLDLGKDYPYLELAVFEGKYFVSFPPFPSYLMFPFALIHWYTADGFIALASAIIGAVYAFKIMELYGIKKERAVFFAAFLTIGSNWIFTAQTAWVWFIAQNLAFTFSLMALYYAADSKIGLSLTFWACAVGCRPLQALYLPVILYLFLKRYKKENPEDKLTDVIKKKWKCAVPMALIALSYMILNFARFGNPLEFGHNYLPEFTRTTTGQFNIAYMKENLPKLLRLPVISFKKAWEYQSAEGTCMLLVSPIFISYIVYVIRSFIRKDNSDKKLVILAFAMLLLELVFTAAHKTMGGAQFGNRYTNDVLPLVFITLAAVLPEKKPWEKYNAVLLLMGLTINIIGSVLFYAK
ncbi:MAG: hypothetical protein ACI4DP_07615 [Candidatus Ornithomonoglobus sp.]